MTKNTVINQVKNILTYIVIFLLGCSGIVFSILYFQTFSEDLYDKYFTLLVSVSVSIISVLTIFTLLISRYNKRKFLFKLCYLTILLINLTVIALYILNITGFLDKIDSVEDLRKFISSYGNFAIVIFVLIQFAQVVFLPIPAFITVGAGVLMFGAFKGALLSVIGIILGSILAFFIGRIFGYPVVKWLVGKQNLEVWLKKIKGKDKVILTFMFLFPFFPDDILCFVAGITEINVWFFIIMIFITRIISVFVSSYSMNNSLIPYDTWWGIILWAVFICLTIFLTVIIYKKGDKIESYIKQKLEKNKRNNM